MDEILDGADWMTFPSTSVALSSVLPGPVVPGFQKVNLDAMHLNLNKKRSGTAYTSATIILRLVVQWRNEKVCNKCSHASYNN